MAAMMLSRFAQNGDSDNFFVTSPAPSVVGMQGRRQLKRTGSTTGKRSSVALTTSTGYAWAERNWMDKQRQYLQAYEYLCHIGEAKEWIEKIIQKPIPPIVQLEEALRDGVMLAETVQALYPDRIIRIFRHPKLQYRHSDNIALFFRFLAGVDLPETFRFELIDIYEKKNIPKVIYCIHALSWLLYRKGIVGFRIGNLVGQLEFERHEVEEMQKGLDKAGVSMPSFSGVSANFVAEPEPEPVETEQERIERELLDNEATVVALQAQARGAMVRNKLGQRMEALWSAEEMIMDLQARIRGDWARQIFGYRLHMKHFAVNLQSAARGFLVRLRQRRREQFCKSMGGIWERLQAQCRGKMVRDHIQEMQSRLGAQNEETDRLQALARGIAVRKEILRTRAALTASQSGVLRLQSSIRGFLSRRKHSHDLSAVQGQLSSITDLQALSRGYLVRQKDRTLRTELLSHSVETQSGLLQLQSCIRGSLLRKRQFDDRIALEGQSTSITDLQAFSRGYLTRQKDRKLRAELFSQPIEAQSGLLQLQSSIRGFLSRSKYFEDLSALKGQSISITELQALSRGHLTRKKDQELRAELHSHTVEVTQLQSLARAMLLRGRIGMDLAQLEDEEYLIVELQAAARGMLVRKRFAEKKRFYQENMEKVVKLQSFVRARIQGEAYKSLINGTNPPVGTIKGFVHLLNDSDFDFNEEIELERSRKTVIQHVRQNEMAEQYIQQLDIKIALLVKNKITLDEVVKHQKHYGGHVGNLLANIEISSHDPFDLKALNKNSRRKLEHYQELFFILQTQPQYLARLFKKIREQATAERDGERLKHLMMGLFGYAQKSREEYYLLKLIVKSIKEEIDHCVSITDYLRSNYFWSKLFGAYVKSPRDRKYMRDVLGPIVKENIIANPELDLESDPMQIYLSSIENEQLRTGQRSRRRPDIPREEAIRDPETRETFIIHLQDLRDLTDQFLATLEESLHRIPYGVRYVAKQMYLSLISRFQHEEDYMLQIVGHWVWKTYLQPALTDPEKHGVVDRGLSQLHKRNLGEVAKVLGQIASGRLFGDENVYLQPLNSFIGESIERVGEIWRNLVSIPDAEAQFDIDEFNDLYARTKPTLFIKMADIFSIHQLVAAETSSICPTQDDPLREVIRELGSAKSNESELMAVSTSEISLTLNPKLRDVEDPNAEIKALFMEAKRCVLYIIRVQSGANLIDIMIKPITTEDEDRWESLVQDELSAGSQKKGAYSEATTLGDIATLPYIELKRIALENILRLEEYGVLTRHNQYQGLLNSIAVDIRTKHRRRVQRERELDGVKLTLGRLNDQAVYLEQQLKTYNDYIEQAMITLQNKKGKKRFLLPFTKQWDHERELQRSGRIPKFGSFKYSAQELANRGILVSWSRYNERQLERIDLTISSNEVGVFTIEGSNGPISMPGASAAVPLDELLQAQYNNTKYMEVFERELSLNVNLFLHLIMRKFYKDRD